MRNVSSGSHTSFSLKYHVPHLSYLLHEVRCPMLAVIFVHKTLQHGHLEPQLVAIQGGLERMK